MQNRDPLIKKAENTEKLNIGIDETTKDDYVFLKDQCGIDTPECIRRAVKREVARLIRKHAPERRPA